MITDKQIIFQKLHKIIIALLAQTTLVVKNYFLNLILLKGSSSRPDIRYVWPEMSNPSCAALCCKSPFCILESIHK
jgi:hypothetical protein